MSEPKLNELLTDLSLWIHQEKDRTQFFRPFEKQASKSSSFQDKPYQPEAIFPEELKSAKVLVLYSSVKEKEVSLVQKMAQAIDGRIAKACALGFDKAQSVGYFEQLKEAVQSAKWILIPESDLFDCSSLTTHYKNEVPRKLLGLPVFFLSELSCYLEDVELKKQLWMTLLRTL